MSLDFAECDRARMARDAAYDRWPKRPSPANFFSAFGETKKRQKGQSRKIP
jgi:hypothetical protein